MPDFASVLADLESGLVTAIRSGQVDPGTLTQVQSAAQSVANQAQVAAAASQGARVGSAAGAISASIAPKSLALYALVGLGVYLAVFRKRGGRGRYA